ncbi:MAG: PAS domain S-box protein, partial [bacterium]
MKTIRQFRPLEDLRDLRARDYICALYEDDRERLDVTADFIQKGLDAGEKVIVVEGISTFEILLAHFDEAKVQFQQHLMRGQLTFVDLDSRALDFSAPDRTVAFLRLEESRAMEEGYDTCRFAVDMSAIICRAANTGQHALYMTSMDAFYRGGRCMALCLYERKSCSTELLLDILRSHQIVMVGRQLYENFYYLRGGFMHGAGPEEGDRWLQNLVDHRQVDMALQKLSGVVEQTADIVIITDRNGVIEYVNPAFEKLTGFSRDETVDRKPNLIRSNQHDDSFYADLWKTISAGRAWRGEITNRKKNGELYWEEKTITPIRDARGTITHYVSTGKDITESRRVAEKLGQTKDLLEAVFQASPFAIVSMGTDLNVTMWNRAAERLFGWSAAEVLGKPLPTVPDDRRDHFEKVNHDVAKGMTLTWSFPLSANEADLLGQHFFLDKFLPNCFSMLDEQYTSAGKQALGAR